VAVAVAVGGGTAGVSVPKTTRPPARVGVSVGAAATCVGEAVAVGASSSSPPPRKITPAAASATSRTITAPQTNRVRPRPGGRPVPGAKAAEGGGAGGGADGGVLTNTGRWPSSGRVRNCVSSPASPAAARSNVCAKAVTDGKRSPGDLASARSSEAASAGGRWGRRTCGGVGISWRCLCIRP